MSVVPEGKTPCQLIKRSPELSQTCAIVSFFDFTSGHKKNPMVLQLVLSCISLSSRWFPHAYHIPSAPEAARTKFHNNNDQHNTLTLSLNDNLLPCQIVEGPRSQTTWLTWANCLRMVRLLKGARFPCRHSLDPPRAKFSTIKSYANNSGCQGLGK